MTAARSQLSPAERLLDAAAALFAGKGIRAVGVEQVLARADAHRASLYHSFGSKDGLVVAYLRSEDERDRAAYQRARASIEDPAEQVLVAFDLAARNARKRGFRGCLYLNAATEFPDGKHPCLGVVQEHRQGLATVWREALGQTGVSDPERLVAELTVIYDGGLAGSKAVKSTEPIELARELAADRIQAAR